MLIKNCKIIFIDKIELGSVLIENGKIKKINPQKTNCSNIIDANGLYLSPGFIDTHIHGAGGCDTMDGTYDSLNKISKTIAKHGTTSFIPTTMTVSMSNINQSLKACSEAKIKGTEGAQIIGVHLEGPFINPNSLGAQNPKYLATPSIENYVKLTKNYEDIVTKITLAPEIPGCLDLISYLSKKSIICSIGHTKATYNQTMESIKYGISHSTHLYNTMTPFTHREPGSVGATFDSNITTETICDGIHISFPALRIAYKQKGTDKILLISDAMEACGMPDGNYNLGGQKVIVSQGAARLKNGALAGSILTLDKAVYNVFNNTDYPLYEVIKMATFNPAKHCKINDTKGLIKEGYDADLLLFDENINIKNVFIKGKKFI